MFTSTPVCPAYDGYDLLFIFDLDNPATGKIYPLLLGVYDISFLLLFFFASSS